MKAGSPSIVIMGVAGCGKSSLGVALAKLLGVGLIEGDEHHSQDSLSKMRQGIALTDDDRDGWLGKLAQELQAHPKGIVLTCSALKRVYRDRLRSSAPSLRFIYLQISKKHALARVSQRAATHFFSSSLVDSQFATLEPPEGEVGVLRIDAAHPLHMLLKQASAWLEAQKQNSQEAA